MQIDTIMPPNFNGRIAKIIAEIRTRTCINDVDTEVLKGLLKDEFERMDEDYEKEYYYATSSVHNSAYDAGYDAGYAAGYSEGNSVVQYNNR